MIKHVEYHSRDWSQLVEQGWITLAVSYGIAEMIRP